jgi:thermitase
MPSDDIPEHERERVAAYADYQRHLISYIKPKPSESDPKQSPPEEAERELELFDVELRKMLQELDVIPLDLFSLGESQAALGYVRNRTRSVDEVIRILQEKFSDYRFFRNTLVALQQQTVNDPLYRRQWALHKIQAEAAWQHFSPTQGNSVTVAIIDSGVKKDHQDLAQVNIVGGNFIPGTTGYSDDDGHGTLLAGTIAAVTNNSAGIAGTVPPPASWLTLMALKFTDIRLPPLAYAAAHAITYAAGYRTGPYPRPRANIINIAWHLLEHNHLVRDALALAEQRGVLVVAAAGNQGSNNIRIPTVPASYALSNMISVMASDRSDDKPGFSNYGSNVDIAAPGVDILSTGLYFRTPAYREYTGTSPAAAQVSAAAAMVLALHGSWSPSQIRDHLVASAEPARHLRGLCRADGRLSLRRAIEYTPLSVVRPAGGEKLQRGSMYEVRWKSDYLTPAVTTVAISINGQSLQAGLPNNGQYKVALPNNAIAAAVIRVSSEQQANLYAESRKFAVV